MRSYYSMDIKFDFCKMERVMEMVMMAADINFNTSERYTLNMVKTGNFMLCLPCHNFKNWKQSPQNYIAQEFSSWISGLRTRLVSMRMGVPSPASLSRLRIWRCHELQCWPQMQLGIWHCWGCGTGWQLQLRFDP